MPTKPKELAPDPPYPYPPNPPPIQCSKKKKKGKKAAPKPPAKKGKIGLDRKSGKVVNSTT
jgi:hypothetical protein